MDDKKITLICGTIVIIGIIISAFFYEPEFKETSIKELIETKRENPKGVVFARVDYVIKNYPSTQAIINDGTSATIYYPKETNLKKNDFVYAYIELEDKNKKAFYAYKLVKD